MAALPKERIFEPMARDTHVAIIHASSCSSSSSSSSEGMRASTRTADPAATAAVLPARRRAAQRGDLERLRRRLAEPCELAQRDLLTLLSYAVGGDGDPVVGLLDDTRATIGMLSELPSNTEPNLLVSLERRLAVALELYARATANEND